MQRGLRVLVAGLLVAGSVCACHRGVATGVDGTQPAAAEVRVEVVNHFELSMEIYAAGAGTTHRLGLVAPGTTRTFMVPTILIGNGTVEFTAQPSGYGPVVHTELLVLHAGHVVDFEITTNLVGSRATIRM